MSYFPLFNLLRSEVQLPVLIARCETKGSRVFTVRAPELWNDLSDKVRLAKSVSSFIISDNLICVYAYPFIYIFLGFLIIVAVLILFVITLILSWCFHQLIKITILVFLLFCLFFVCLF